MPTQALVEVARAAAETDAARRSFCISLFLFARLMGARRPRAQHIFSQQHTQRLWRSKFTCKTHSYKIHRGYRDGNDGGLESAAAVEQLVVLGGRVGTITQLSGSNVAVSICGRSMWRDRRAVLPLLAHLTRAVASRRWVRSAMSQGSNVAPQQQEKVGQVVIAQDGRLSIRVAHG